MQRVDYAAGRKTSGVRLGSQPNIGSGSCGMGLCGESRHDAASRGGSYGY
jgi:hypothetical protein